MATEKQFRVWVFRPRGWQEGDAGRLGATLPFSEPAEAADVAEKVLQATGVPGRSYCELRFNGDEIPHSVICYLEDRTFGIWNTDAAKWPIFYPPEGQDSMLTDFPFDPAKDGSAWDRQDEREDEDDSDEGTEDEEIQEDDEQKDSDQDSDSGNDETDDDSDEDEEDEGEEDEDDSGEDEKERPRLTLFAKFRTPKGWRKRAETEELLERNTFAFKLGVLDEDAEKTGQQEREVFAEVQFIEDDTDREAGTLRMKLPAGIEFSEPTKSGWITARIPYRQED